MLSQEALYQLIFHEEWKEVLDILHRHRKDIAADLLLQQAASIFEQEFFSKLPKYPIDRKEIEEYLEILYLLNSGKFYLLKPESHQNLILELVKRKTVEEAVNYAREYPNNEECQKTILEYERRYPRKQPEGQTIKSTTMNWIEIYNRLFEVINVQGDAATYFSGPRFIDTVREITPYHADYKQYIDHRNAEGKSTSRKIFYYDILMSLPEEARSTIVNRILDIVRPHATEKVNRIDLLLGNSIPHEKPKQVVEEIAVAPGAPIVFISYSWDDEKHKEWVLNLANRLTADGIDVILDRYNLKPGKNLPHFVESSISRANRIIIVFTPNYKLKADKRTGGVGYEYSIMNADLYKHQTENGKIIPVLRTGNMADSIPTFMHQFIHIDATNDEFFENSYADLIREIYDEPEIQKPVLGSKPNFRISKKKSE